MVCASCESRTCFTGQGNMPDACPARYRMTTQTGYGIGVIACNPAAQAQKIK